MILLLRPVDTFFFRNHKAFSPGEDSSAAAIFPPRPGTIYGALRSAYIHARSDFVSFRNGTDEEVKYWMGTIEKLGAFKLKGSFLYADGQMILPLPMDHQVIQEKMDNVQQEFAYPLKLEENQGCYSSDGGEWKLCGVRNEKSASSSGGYQYWQDWHNSQLQRGKTKVYRASDWITTEDKIGIARDWKTAAGIQGMLYNMQLHRFKNPGRDQPSSGFAVVCEAAPDFTGVKYLRLGGKNRPWTLEELKDDSLFQDTHNDDQIIEQIERSGIARLILLTPAIWSVGDSDFYLDRERIFRINDQLSCPIMAEAMGRPELIGGWDVADNRPKKRMLAVPAGSVFYLQVPKGQARVLVQGVKTRQLSDELPHEGYGWAACAAYNNEGGR